MMPLFVEPKKTTAGKKLLQKPLDSTVEDPSSISSNVAVGNIHRKLQMAKAAEGVVQVVIQIAKFARSLAQLIGLGAAQQSTAQSDTDANINSYPDGGTEARIEYSIGVAQSIQATFGTVSVAIVTGLSGRVNNDGSTDMSPQGQLVPSAARYVTASLILKEVTPQCLEYTSTDVETCRVRPG